jgi:hypothetical protein
MRLSKQLFWNQLYLKVVKSANTPHWPPGGQFVMEVWWRVCVVATTPSVVFVLCTIFSYDLCWRIVMKLRVVAGTTYITES